MPVHDWTRVGSGIYHAFHHSWIDEIKRMLNAGVLPSGYYALAEQLAGGRDTDVLKLKGPAKGGEPDENPPGAMALAVTAPMVHYRARAELDVYAAKAKVVVVRHTSQHQVIAMVEVVSLGNKSSRHGLHSFVEKAAEFLRAGVHLLILDLLPPGPRDPQGIPKAIWDEMEDNNFTLPDGKPLSIAAFIGRPIPEVFIEPIAVGNPLQEMPLFLTPDDYVPVPLEGTYQSAWEAVPSFWRDVVSGAASS